MADPTYQPKVYRKQGGDEYVVAASGALTIESSGTVGIESGGQVTVESSGELEIESGGLVQVESGGTVELEAASILDLQNGTLFKDTTLGVNTERFNFVDKKTLTGTASTAGGIGNWQAPTGTAVIITAFQYDITAASATAGAVLDIGVATTNATTKSDTLIDGLVATGSITGVKNDVEHAGTNGVNAQKIAAGKWITVTSTGSKATSLAGSIYVHYTIA